MNKLSKRLSAQKKKPEFNLIVWASSSYIWLAQGHFLFEDELPGASKL